MVIIFFDDLEQKKTVACDSMRITGHWAGLDSNQRKLPLMDLQSIPFSHSGTDPERK